MKVTPLHVSKADSTKHGLCATCHHIYALDEMDECVHCSGRTCPNCIPMCCLEQVTETYRFREAVRNGADSYEGMKMSALFDKTPEWYDAILGNHYLHSMQLI